MHIQCSAHQTRVVTRALRCTSNSSLTARLAQSAERKALNLVVVGSSPTVGVLLYTLSIMMKVRRRIHNDPGRTRTCNPRLRRPMPYPLGHGATCTKNIPETSSAHKHRKKDYKHADMHRNASSTHITTQRSSAKHRNACGRTEHTLNLRQNARIRAASVWEHSSTRLGT